MLSYVILLAFWPSSHVAVHTCMCSFMTITETFLSTCTVKPVLSGHSKRRIKICFED